MNTASKEQPAPAATMESVLDKLAACQHELAESRILLERAIASSAVETDQRQCLLATLEAAHIGLWEGELRKFSLAEQWSPRFREIFGVSLEAQVSHELFLKCLHPADREKVERAV